MKRKCKINDKIIRIILMILLGSLFFYPFFWNLDQSAADKMYQCGYAGTDQIILITMDETDIDHEHYGNPSRWSRTLYADILNRLYDRKCKPAVVGFDVLFTDYGYQNEYDAGDKAFVKAVQAFNKASGKKAVVVASQLSEQETYQMELIQKYLKKTVTRNTHVELPYPQLKDVTAQGYVNCFTDSDGIVRHTILYQKINGSHYDSFAHCIARIYCDTFADEPKHYIMYTASPKEDNSHTVYETVTLRELLNGEVPTETFDGKIVLIGAWAPGLLDSVKTSIDHANEMYGLEVHTDIIYNLIDSQKFSQKTELGGRYCNIIQLLLFAAVSYLYAVVIKHITLTKAFFTGCAGILLNYFVCKIIFTYFDRIMHPLWIPVGIIVLFMLEIAIRYMHEYLEKKALRVRFGQYIDSNLLEKIICQGEDALSPEGKERKIAILFVDICGFTALSELLIDPKLIVKVLNEYLTIITECLTEKAVLDKYIGDAAMIFFCAPDETQNSGTLDDTDYVLHAVETAFAMVGRTEELQEKVLSLVNETEKIEKERKIELIETLKNLGFAVGIHCGDAVIGNIGSQRRMDYTAIGATVNYAARLESLKIIEDGVLLERAGKIYISEAMRNELLNHYPNECTTEFDMFYLGSHKIKGMRNEQRIYSIQKR